MTWWLSRSYFQILRAYWVKSCSAPLPGVWGKVHSTQSSGLFMQHAFPSLSPLPEKSPTLSFRGIQVILVMSVILWHEKTKIRKIIGFGNFDVISVKTIIHNNIKKMGHLIWSLGVQLHAISWKWDVTRWHKAGWMIVVTCQTLFFCHKGTISAQ